MHRTVAVLLGAAVLSLALSGCAEFGDTSSGTTESRETSGATTATPSGGGTTVGEVAAEIELKPVGDSGTSGTVIFKNIGTLGVQTELRVSGLPKPGSAYYAQIHEGECTDLGTGGHENKEGHEHSALGPSLALVRLDGLIAKAAEYAHGGHDEDLPEDELPGNIDQPITIQGSADGTASVVSLLEGVALDRIFSGEPKYLDLHAADSEDAPPLACADLRKSSHGAGRS
jgi:hypothetical protein